MFELDNMQTWVETQADHVIDIYNSINRSTVAPPDRVPESAQSYIATVYRDGAYEVCIYLYLTASNEGLIYRWSEGAVPADRVNDLYQAAFQFSESMGFMMDDMRYREKSAEEKEQTFAQVPMFHQDLSFLRGQEPEAEAAPDELVIEAVDDEPALEVVSEGAEEVNLDQLGETGEVSPVEVSLEEEPVEINLEEPVEEITTGGSSSAGEIELDPGADDEVALDTLETKLEEAPPETSPAEDELLSGLEAEPAPVEPPPIEELEEIVLESPGDEQAMETPPRETISDLSAGAELTAEEARVLGDFAEPAPAVSEFEEIGMAGLTEAGPAPAAEVPAAVELDLSSDEVEVVLETEPELEPEARPAEAEPPPPEEPALEELPVEMEAPPSEPEPEPEPAAALGAEVELPEGLSDRDYKILVSFLAMM